jgi:hypothetical protein
VPAFSVGRELLRHAIEIKPEIQSVLSASKIVSGYYAHLGWQKIENVWFWPRQR